MNMKKTRRSREGFGGIMAALILFMGLVCPVSAQEAGSVTGMVVDGSSGRPLAGAQVYRPGSGGTLTDATGRFLLLGVPAGEAVIRVEMIGFATQSQTVDVRPEEASQVTFRLSPQAIGLEELVVTGAGVATQKRKLGNSIGTMNTAELETAPISSVNELLQGRTPGVQMSLSGGTVGTGGVVRVRGMKSVSLSGDPVIYIDGVRVDGSSNTDLSVGGQDLSRLQDLNTNDIDRVEVVRGAAAATLYGTQGSNGVIQIFTKRGRTGAPQWSAEIEQGFHRIPSDTFPGRLFTQFQGPGGFQAQDPKQLIENGHVQRYNLSVSGGTEAVTYYASAGFGREEGSIAPHTNWQKQGSGRVNLNAEISPTFTLGIRSGLMSTQTRIPDNDNGLHGIYSQAVSAIPYTADEDRVFGERWGSVIWNATLENRQNVLRNTTGLTLDHRPSEMFRHSFTAGIDWYRQESWEFFPFAYKGAGNALGNKETNERYFRDVTVDYQGTVSNRIGDGITSDLTVGAQGNFTNTVVVEAFGDAFPGPGVKTVGAAAVTQGDETRIEEINAGIFAQETVGLGDRVFITAGLRIDGNSAFGNAFDYQTYPKASIAYNISDESFWPRGVVPTLKLRAAFGTSGLAPAQFAADRTFEPIAAEQGQPAVTPGNIGDPELGPEQSQEVELGFDAGFWDDRLGLEVTGFWQRTVDALLERQSPVSQGFSRPQLTNIGEIQNRGIEAALRAFLVRTDDFEWNATAQITAQKNEVTDLGGLAPFSAGGATRISEGFPVQGMWGYELAGWDPVAREHTRTSELSFHGQTDPKWFGALSSDIRFGDFSLRGSADYAGGHVQNNFSRWWSIRVRTGDDYLSLVEKPTGAPTAASDSILDFALTVGGEGDFFVEPADYLVLREVSLSYDIPGDAVARLGMDRATVTLAGRNLKEWSKYGGISPQTNWNGNNNIGRGEDFNTMAPLRTFLISFRTVF